LLDLSFPVIRNFRKAPAETFNIFRTSLQAAERLAMIYSLMGTCKLNDINPYEWLKDVLGKINSWPSKKVHELLPHRWKLTTA
jgi:transposase